MSRNAKTIMRYKPGYGPNPIRTFPRNLPCLCGSGAKFKKCCLPKLPVGVELKKIPDLKKNTRQCEAYIVALKNKGIIFKKDENDPLVEEI